MVSLFRCIFSCSTFSGDMKRITHFLRTLVTCELRRLHVRSMTAATVPVRRISWSQYRNLHHQVQGKIIQGRCLSSLVSGTDESSFVDFSDDEYQYVREISNIPITGHRVLVVQPEMKIKIERSSVQLKLEETCALIRTLPCWHVVGKTTARTVSDGRLFSDHILTRLTSLVTSINSSSAVVIGVDMLTPVQLNTLQTLWGLPVFDRYTVVLQILKEHARTSEAKLQVAMAEIPHLRCRLSGVTEQHKQRQSGRGTRDTWLHNSQRLLQERELKLRTALRQVKNQRSLVRKKRQKKNIPTVAVVGYTNSGKTSLIEALTGDRKLESRDQLFATLDVTTHAGTLPNMMSVLFIDTVGFIADIPVMLMEAFAATLEDAVLADLVLHVCDTSHQDCWRQRETVVKALRPMLLNHQIDSIIEVWNKVDIACDNRFVARYCLGSGRCDEGRDMFF